MQSLLCFGDSNTHGRKPDGSGRFPFEQRWPGILERGLGGAARIIEEGLNGRCSVWDEPFRPGRNGAKLLLPLLQSHAPLDWVLLMLGTNDILHFHEHTAYDAARGNSVLIDIIQSSKCGINNLVPKILLISPPEIGPLSESILLKTHGRPEQAADFAKHYAEVAKATGCEFFNAAEVCQPSSIDGVHLDAVGHLGLGKALLQKLQPIISQTEHC